MADKKQLEVPINPGEQIDHYRIDTMVNRSGVATTYRATDLLTDRAVALKVPHPEMESDPVFAERFRREQEVGALLDHPGVVKVVGDKYRSRAYMVTEWFEGRPLREIMKEEGRIPEERAVRIAIETCLALDYVHSRGIVHCNVKPENILVDALDRIRLIHFDVASKVVARRLTFTKLSQLEETSDYVSPEELKGKRPDAQSDVYALGVVLYEMVTARLPFPSKKVFDRVLNYPVPPREVNPQISPQLQEVLYRALEREPKNRYAKARDFARDLEHLDQVGVADRPELHNWRKRQIDPFRKALLYAGLAVILMAVLAAIFYFARR